MQVTGFNCNVGYTDRTFYPFSMKFGDNYGHNYQKITDNHGDFSINSEMYDETLEIHFFPMGSSSLPPSTTLTLQVSSGYAEIYITDCSTPSSDTCTKNPRTSNLHVGDTVSIKFITGYGYLKIDNIIYRYAGQTYSKLSMSCSFTSTFTVPCTPCPYTHTGTMFERKTSNECLETCPARYGFDWYGNCIETECLPGNRRGAYACVPCTVCQAGYTVQGSCATWSDYTCDICPAGSFCPETNTNTIKPCTPGSFCTEGVTSPTQCTNNPCQNGQYINKLCDSTSDTSCDTCPAEFYCINGNKLNCIQGSFCPTGVSAPIICTVNPCSNGQYINKLCDSSSDASCAMCPAGFYCVNGIELDCTQGSFCPFGTSTPTPCTANPCSDGQYINKQCNSISDATCDMCQSGYFCINGIKQSCAANHFCVAGVSNPTACKNVCPTGYYTSKICSSTSDTIFDICPLGHYCRNSIKTLCDYGKIAPSTGSTSCIECNIGQYPNKTGQCQDCVNTCINSTAITKRCLINGSAICCGNGTYFLDGISTACMECNAGTYSLDGSGKACNQCPLGFYCPKSSMAMKCPEGYYCRNTTSKQICDSNYFCASGSVNPLKCDPKTPLSPLRSTSSNDCYNAMEGTELSPVTIISNGIKQTPKFKLINGEKDISNRMYFVFTNTGKSVNSITFRRKVSNVEVFTVGGGGAGGKAMAYGDFRGLGNDVQKKANISAGGGGGAGLLIYQKFFPNISTTYNVRVGAGGMGKNTPIQIDPYYGVDGESGENTVLSNGDILYIVATGGGGGGQWIGKNGGSGGGSYRVYNKNTEVTNDAGVPDSTSTVCLDVWYSRQVQNQYQNPMKQPSINQQYGCPGLAGYVSPGFLYSGPGGGSSSTGISCKCTGGSGMSVDITGTFQPYAAGGGGYGVGNNYGFPCTAGRGGAAWNDTVEIVIGGSVPGGDGYPNTGSGGGSAGPGNTKSGSGADGVLIIAWDPFIYPCLPDSFKLPGDINSTACTQCQLGSFTFSERATVCSKCEPSTFPNMTSKLCQACRYTATCNPQTPSKRCSNDGSTVCCGRDTFFIDGISTHCMPCDEGSYSANGSESECILCPPGFNCSSGPPHTCQSNFWADNGKCTPCTPACNPGYLVKSVCSKENNTECTICTPGSFCPTNFTTIVCPHNTYCPAGSTALIPCPESMRSEMGSYNLKNCSFSKKGRYLSPVTVMFNGTKQSPTFKFKNSTNNFGQLFEFKVTNNTNNTFTFYGNISNVEILAVGGGGAGGNAIAASALFNNLEQAGGGGGAGMLFYTTSFMPIIARTYNVKVGFGGRGVDTVQKQSYFSATNGVSGGNTELSFNNTVFLKATGGGGGGMVNGMHGGSGGGSFTSDAGPKDPDAECVHLNSLENSMYEAYPEIKHACDGVRGYNPQFSGGGGGAYGSILNLADCYAKGGSGMMSRITGTLTPYAAGGGGYSTGYKCKYNYGGHVWSETGPVIIGGSTPGGDGYPNSGSGGASAGSGTKSGSGADGVFIIAWDPVLSLCPLYQYNDMDDSTSCTRCQLGSFTYTEGATACSKCEPNTFPNMTSRQCQACRDTATCSSQLPSKKCRNDGSTVCCGIDTYFIDGISTQCMPCDEWSYSTDGSGMECTPCVENSKKSNPTQGYFCECDLAQGLYMHNSTLNTCSFCPENNFCPAQGTASPCPIGTHRYEGDTRTDICQPCENTPQIGEYTWLNSSRCTFQCNAGYYVDNPLDSLFLCNKCTRENFTCTAAGQTEPNCSKTKQVCPLGQYTPACEIGRTSDNTGCKYCPAALGAIWTVLCDFTCGTGKFRNTTSMKKKQHMFQAHMHTR